MLLNLHLSYELEKKKNLWKTVPLHWYQNDVVKHKIRGLINLLSSKLWSASLGTYKSFTSPWNNVNSQKKFIVQNIIFVRPSHDFFFHFFSFIIASTSKTWIYIFGHFCWILFFLMLKINGVNQVRDLNLNSQYARN